MKRFESLGGKRLGDEGSLDVAAEDLRDQRAGGAGDQLEPYLGVGCVIARQHRRQAGRRGALERADAQRAARRAAAQRRLGLGRKPQQALGIGEEQLALGGERQAPLVAVKQRRAEALLELLDARGDVRLHAVQPRGSLGDAAGLRDGLEDVQRGEVHDLSERTTLS